MTPARRARIAGWAACALAWIAGCSDCRGGVAPESPASTRATPAAPAVVAAPADAPKAEPALGPWRPVLATEANDRDVWFSTLWASERDAVYVAGKRGVTRVGRDDAIDALPLPTDDAMLGVFGQSDTEVYAVGGRGAVVRYDGARWQLERKPGPDVPRSGQLLHSVGHFLGDRALVAFGPSLSLSRDASGHWTELSADRDRALRQAVRPHGIAPPSCEDLSAHVVFRGALYAACGGVLYRHRESDWQRVTVAEDARDLRELAASEHCVFAAGKRSVYRQCTAP